MTKTTIVKHNFNDDYEFIERKGLGHPDTLADALAETLSVKYSLYTLKKYGAILHHNFDKVGLLGGASYVTFGKGHLTSPIRILLNGRVSTSFADDKIPVKKLLTQWTNQFFKKELPLINVKNDLKFHYNLSHQSSPGKTYESESQKGTRRYWFEPRDLDDIKELKCLVSNDTSLGVGYAPCSPFEKLILNIEKYLNSKTYKKEHPWCGTDIKIMAVRNKDKHYVTICIPQIANHVNNVRDYIKNLATAKKDISKKIVASGIKNYEININTRDDFKTCELYLTAIGSSIESGDEGLVGRGNRINGLITPSKPMSMEGVGGKNPVYHIGKLYNLGASVIANKIYKKFGIKNQIYIVSQSGRNLLDPWITIIAVPEPFNDKKALEKLVKNELKKMPSLTQEILKSKFPLY